VEKSGISFALVERKEATHRKEGAGINKRESGK